MSKHPSAVSALGREGLIRCAEERKNRPDRECDTILVRLEEDRVTVRCRNCTNVHVFRAEGGRIVAEGLRTPLGAPSGICAG